MPKIKQHKYFDYLYYKGPTTNILNVYQSKATV